MSSAAVRCDAVVVRERVYRLTVEGELSDRMRPAFEGMTLTRERGNTVLAGLVRDQSELQAVLLRVSDLGLTLLSAVAVDEEVARP
jgi:hypothetical protein